MIHGHAHQNSISRLCSIMSKLKESGLDPHWFQIGEIIFICDESDVLKAKQEFKKIELTL